MPATTPPGQPLPADAVWFGEVSLAGEIRPVAHASIRQREAAKLGFVSAFAPAGLKTAADKTPADTGLQIHMVADLGAFIEKCFGDIDQQDE